MPFNFAWSVEDEPSHNDYSYQVNSDGKITNGSYRVVLPDGRTQMVTEPTKTATSPIFNTKERPNTLNTSPLASRPSTLLTLLSSRQTPSRFFRVLN